MKSLEQKRARHAWNVVQSVKTNEWEEFERESKKLAARILTAGIGQAVLFLEAKKSAPALRAGLEEWLKERRPLGTGEQGRVVLRVVHGDVDFLRFATAESLAYLQWVVRFAEALALERERAGSASGLG